MKLIFMIPLFSSNVRSKSSHGNPIFVFKFIFILLSCLTQFGHDFHFFLFLFFNSLSLLFLYFLPFSLLSLQLIQIKIMNHMKRRYSAFLVLWRIIIVFIVFILFRGEMGWFVFDNWWKCSWCLTKSSHLCYKKGTFWWLFVFPMWFLPYYLLIEYVLPFCFS